MDRQIAADTEGRWEKKKGVRVKWTRRSISPTPLPFAWKLRERNCDLSLSLCRALPSSSLELAPLSRNRRFFPAPRPCIIFTAIMGPLELRSIVLTPYYLILRRRADCWTGTNRSARFSLVSGRGIGIPERGREIKSCRSSDQKRSSSTTTVREPIRLQPRFAGRFCDRRRIIGLSGKFVAIFKSFN